MELLIAIISLFAIGLCTWRVGMQCTRSFRRVFWFALSIKLLAGILLGLVYTYYYGEGDTLAFFAQAAKLVSLFDSDKQSYFYFLLWGHTPLGIYSELNTMWGGTLFMVKITSVVSLMAMRNYWIVSLYFSWISFLGAWYLLRTVSRLFPTCTGAALIAFLFFPSVVFWSSGVTKESLAVASLFFLTGIYLTVMKNKKPKQWKWILCIPAIIFLWSLKYYWAALFFSSVLTGVVTHRLLMNYIKTKYPAIEIAVWSTTFLVLFLTVSMLHPNLNIHHFFGILVDNHDIYTLLPGDKVDIHFSHLKASWWSILYNSPWALFSALYRPTFFETSTLFQFIIAFENAVLLVLTLYALYRIITTRQTPSWSLLCSAVVYIGLVCIFLALSTPNFGTLSRYRVGFLPFLLFLLLYQAELVFPWRRLKLFIKNMT